MKAFLGLMVFLGLVSVADAKTEVVDMSRRLKWIFCVSVYEPPATTRVLGRKSSPSEVMKLKVSYLNSLQKWQTNVLRVTEAKQYIKGPEDATLVLRASDPKVKAVLSVDYIYDHNARLTINGVSHDYLKMGCTFNEF